MEQLRLRGRKVAVTGASGGLGKALVEALEEHGAAVVAGISRSKEDGLNFYTWQPEAYDIVILNAGFGYIQSSAQPFCNPRDIAEMFDINLFATIQQAQRALAAGAIHVHVVGSILSVVSSPLYALYAATKYALRGWAYGSARELPGRVSISYPNGIRTEYFNNLRGDPALLAYYGAQVEQAQASYDAPEDVAAGILEGIAWGGREIIPTQYALEWFVRNGEDIRRMWHPGLQQPSLEPFDWWQQVTAHIDAANRD